jgi:hypothetical protein
VLVELGATVPPRRPHSRTELTGPFRLTG